MKAAFLGSSRPIGESDQDGIRLTVIKDYTKLTEQEVKTQVIPLKNRILRIIMMYLTLNYHGIFNDHARIEKYIRESTPEFKISFKESPRVISYALFLLTDIAYLVGDDKALGPTEIAHIVVRKFAAFSKRVAHLNNIGAKRISEVATTDVFAQRTVAISHTSESSGSSSADENSEAAVGEKRSYAQISKVNDRSTVASALIQLSTVVGQRQPAQKKQHCGAADYDSTPSHVHVLGQG